MEMTELGELRPLSGKTELHIPDWYEWERANVRDEVLNGTYRFSSEVRVCSLPNSKGYIKLGKGRSTDDSNGFVLEGKYGAKSYRREKPSPPCILNCYPSRGQ